jgi:hypothetical protein
MKQTRLSTVFGTIVVGIILLLGSAASAHGASLCIQLTGGENVQLIGASAALPANGKCKPWVGFVLPGGAPSTGMVCKSATGTSANFSISTTTPAPISLISIVDLFSLPVPSMAGGIGAETQENYDGTHSVVSFTATKVACSSTVVPYP